MFPLDKQRLYQPDTPAIIFSDKCWTFSELAIVVAALAEWIRTNFTIRPKVAIVSSVCDAYAITVLSGWKCGGCVCPIPTNWLLLDIIRELNLFRPDVIFCDSTYAEPLSVETKFPVYRLEDLKLEQAQYITPHVPVKAYQTASLEIFTSGSTGIPKRVRLSWRTLETHARISELHLHYTSQDRWLITLPMYHIGGISTLVKSIVSGLSVHIIDGFDATKVNELIQTGTVSILSLVPTTLLRLLTSRNNETLPPSIKFVLLGGGPASKELLLRDSRFLASYGMSEACSQIATVPPDSDESLRVTSGLPLPGVSIEIRDETGSTLTTNSSGEIFVGSAALADGYSNDPDETNRRFNNGWLRTGDYGYVTERGALVVEGRREDRIISGGENIHPQEIERALMNHPKLRNAIIVGIPDSEWGQAAAAVVECNKSVTEQELMLFLKDRIAGFKIPKKWWITGAIPLLPNGKPDRKTLIQHFESDS